VADDGNFDFTRLDSDFIFGVAFRFGLRFHSFQFQGFYDCVEQIVQSPTMLGGDREDFSDPETMEFVGQPLLFLGIDFINRQEKWLAATNQLAGEVDIRGGEFGACIDDHDDGVGFFESDLGLAVNLRRHEIFFFRNNAASIDYAQAVAAPFTLSVETIASDAGLVADDGASRTYDSIEQGGLADVWSSDNGKRRDSCGYGRC